MAVAICQLNPLGEEDARLLEFVGRGEHLITGFRNRDVRHFLYALGRTMRRFTGLPVGSCEPVAGRSERPRIDPENPERIGIR